MAEYAYMCSNILALSSCPIFIFQVMLGFCFVGLPHAMGSGWCASPLLFMLIIVVPLTIFGMPDYSFQAAGPGPRPALVAILGPGLRSWAQTYYKNY